jgi:hypothetical protein
MPARRFLSQAACTLPTFPRCSRLVYRLISSTPLTETNDLLGLVIALNACVSRSAEVDVVGLCQRHHDRRLDDAFAERRHNAHFSYWSWLTCSFSLSSSGSRAFSCQNLSLYCSSAEQILRSCA